MESGVRWCVLLALALLGCSTDTTIHLIGVVEYADYAGGDIVLRVYEDQSCTGRSCHSPGDEVASQRLPGPGTFRLTAHVDEGANDQVALLAHALGDAENVGDCEAGAALWVDVADHSGLRLVLERGVCPTLE